MIENIANAFVANPEEFTTSISPKLVLYSLVAIAILVFLAVVIRNPSQLVKRFLFWSICLIVLSVTIFFIGTTIYINKTSFTSGPIHWHADYEVWACDQKLDLIDPKGRLSNKVGSSSRHEHNDERLHYEGVVSRQSDALLVNFLQALGVNLSHNSLVFPTNSGFQKFVSNETRCANGSSGEVQVFVYRTRVDDLIYQTKLTDFSSYIMRDQTQVPPGDCIIIEFSPRKDKTEKLCRSYQAALTTGKLKGEADGN